MKKDITVDNIKIQLGDKIRILYMDGEPRYTGKIGTVTYIDDIGQLFGTWGGLGVFLPIDKVEVIYGRY